MYCHIQLSPESLLEERQDSWDQWREESRIRINELENRIMFEEEDERFIRLDKIHTEEIEFFERLIKVDHHIAECEEQWRKIENEAEKRQAEHEEKIRQI